MGAITHKVKSDLKVRNHAGNLKDVRWALNSILQAAYAVPGPDALVLFGYAGGGKSSLLDSALFDAIATTKADMDQVGFDCIKLLRRHSDADAALVSLFEDRDRYLQNLPDFRVFVFDEADAIGPVRARVDSPRDALSLFCMDSLNLKGVDVLWLLITNHPAELDDAILSRAGKWLYLPQPDEDAARVVIESRLEAKDATEVFHCLRAPGAEYIFNVRAIRQGLKYLEDLGMIKDKRLNGCTAAQARNGMLGAGGFPPRIAIQRYESEQAYYIKMSKNLLDSLAFWGA